MTEIGRLLKNSNSDDQLFDKIVSIKRITESLDDLTEDKLTTILVALKRLVGFDAATIYLINIKSKKFYAAANFLNSVNLFSESIDNPSDPDSWEGSTESPVTMSVVSASAFGSAGGRAHILSIPMVVQERINGLLNLAFLSDETPPQKTIRLANVLGGQMASAIERCQYRNKLTALYQTLSKMETTLRLSQTPNTGHQNFDEAHDMLVSISHEVNNSLSVIIGNVQCLLMEKEPNKEQHISRLNKIESAAVKIGLANKRLLQIPEITERDDKNQNNYTTKV